MYYFRKKYCLRNTSILLVIICILSSLLNFLLPVEHTKAAINDWVIIGEDGKKADENTIKWTGTHSAADENAIRYRTISYYISREKFEPKIKFSSGSNASIKKKKVNVENLGGHDLNGMKYRNYAMTRKDFIKTAAKLGITADDLINGSVTIYLNPVYETYQGEKTRKSNIFGLQEILAAEYWSETTQKMLENLYNIEYTITASNIYNVNVIAVDKDKNEIKALRSKDKVMFGQPYDPKITDKEKIISSFGVEYQYTDQWSYTYEDRVSEKKNTISNLSSRVYLTEVPDANELTIYMVYDNEKYPPYYVDIIAETEDGEKLTTFEKGKKVEGGSAFEYSLKSNQKTLKDKYYYANKWYLTYTDKNGKKKTGDRKNSEKISQVMPEAMAESTAVFHMIYSLDPDAGDDVPPPEEPEPELPEVTVPKPDYKSMPFTQVTATGLIRADDRSGEKFVATLGVPTTESLYGEIKATDYLIGYDLVKKVGLKKYPIKVKKDYILVWEAATPEEELEEGKEPEQMTETVTIEQVIPVPRAYGYWEIKNFDYYTINAGTLNNYALPNGSITLKPNASYYNVPSVSYYHSNSEDYHIIPPKEVSSGITLPAQTITGKTDKPMLPKEDFTKQAYAMSGKIKVRSDRIIYDGATVMNDKIVETEAPNVNVTPIKQCYAMTNENVLYKPGQVIEATKENGDYGSVGSIDYKCRTSDVSSKNNTLSYPVVGINNVVIHTPVLCDPIVEADNDKYVQLIKPDKNAVQLVLDKNNTLSDFTVKISNTGMHSYMQGYFTRDFSKSLRDPLISYIADKKGILRNEVKFPFDVYIDVGEDGKIENDDFIPANTWIAIGRATARFYLPMWVEEGIYTAEFRTVAINCVGTISGSDVTKTHATEKEKNTNRSHYVATNTVQFEVSGRVYGLNIYDLTDYPLWEEAFRIPASSELKKSYPAKYPNGTKKLNYNKGYYYDYALGTKDQYGKDTGRNIKYTFPLVNGSHPFYKNIGILKTGYMVRFSLETTGSMYSNGAMISIKPSFYFIDKNGKNRTAVDLYYSESFQGKHQPLVKVGSKLDLTNVKSIRTGDLDHGIPENELRQTALVKEEGYGDLIWSTEEMFTFSHIRLTDAFRTFTGNAYAKSVKGLQSYKKVAEDNITEADMIKRTQRWYGAYYLPNHVYAVEKDYNVMDYSQKYGINFSEDFWLKDGYIIINLRIETLDQYGEKHLSYINPANFEKNGNCSMWILEGPPMEKQSYKGPTFKFYAGDFILYDAGKKASDDYSG
ncbi:MAG: hypothetical protein E7255_08815, partial [Lachnospiraceae bacterium]|nr:hypothetical protein [Lachnospiraceae bacterium]